MDNFFGSNADQGPGSSAEDKLNKMLELFEEMRKDQAEMKKDQKKRDAAMKKEFAELKKELKDKEDEAWRGKHGPPFLSFSFLMRVRVIMRS